MLTPRQVDTRMKLGEVIRCGQSIRIVLSNSVLGVTPNRFPAICANPSTETLHSLGFMIILLAQESQVKSLAELESRLQKNKNASS